jgi:hypothetical protein
MLPDASRWAGKRIEERPFLTAEYSKYAEGEGKTKSVKRWD